MEKFKTDWIIKTISQTINISWNTHSVHFQFWTTANYKWKNKLRESICCRLHESRFFQKNGKKKVIAKKITTKKIFPQGIMPKTLCWPKKNCLALMTNPMYGWKIIGTNNSYKEESSVSLVKT